MLFVPGDSEKKLAKGQSTAASALILDLEDSVAADRIEVARAMVREYLSARPDRTDQQLWVRINCLDGPLALPDLVGVVAGGPDGIVLPKIESAQQIVLLDHYLTALEAREGARAGSIRIIAVATETPHAMFAAHTYRGASSRLTGLTWGAEDLSAAIGASTNRTENGEYEFTYQLARSICLLAAHSAGVQAIDTLTTDFRDQSRLEREVRASRRAGFSGKIAIHPDQVAVINVGYSPDAEELRHAHAVVDAFAQAGHAGAVQIDGKMLDKPHLVQAQRIIALGRSTPAKRDSF
ncbi:MAG: CoA ester lyase [Burkholderiaceae bacterium]|nr:CoA ester lyase [Burkholderiaceae bacterium]